MTRSASKRRKDRRRRLAMIRGGDPTLATRPGGPVVTGEMVRAYAACKALGCGFWPGRGWRCSERDGVSLPEPCAHVQAAIPGWRALAGA